MLELLEEKYNMYMYLVSEVVVVERERLLFISFVHVFIINMIIVYLYSMCEYLS